jgi:hypothetical protein
MVHDTLLEEKVKTRPFISNTVNREKSISLQAEIYPRGDYDEFDIAEVCLWNFVCCGTDKTGRNAYSAQLDLGE